VVTWSLGGGGGEDGSGGDETGTWPVQGSDGGGGGVHIHVTLLVFALSGLSPPALVLTTPVLLRARAILAFTCTQPFVCVCIRYKIYT
jgi:hypothetical protein